jgi:hypothetical protein
MGFALFFVIAFVMLGVHRLVVHRRTRLEARTPHSPLA